MPNYNDLIGIPFKMQAQGPEAYDCYALSREVLNRNGIVIPLQQELRKRLIDDLQERSQAIAEGKDQFIEIDKPEPLCIVTFVLRPPYITHMGVILEDGNTFIHTLKKTGVLLSRLDDQPWCKRIDGFYRCRRLNNE